MIHKKFKQQLFVEKNDFHTNKGIHRRWDRFWKIYQKSTIPSCLLAETLCKFLIKIKKILNRFNSNLMLQVDPTVYRIFSKKPVVSRKKNIFV